MLRKILELKSFQYCGLFYLWIHGHRCVFGAREHSVVLSCELAILSSQAMSALQPEFLFLPSLMIIVINGDIQGFCDWAPTYSVNKCSCKNCCLRYWVEKVNILGEGLDILKCYMPTCKKIVQGSCLQRDFLIFHIPVCVIGLLAQYN